MNIDEAIRERALRGKDPRISKSYFRDPFKTKKWNIGLEENLKLSIISYYWDE